MKDRDNQIAEARDIRMLLIPKNYNQLLEAIKGYSEVDSYLEDIFKADDHKRFVKRFLSRISEGTPYPRVQMYKEYFKLPKMIREYYRGITKNQVNEAMILKVGREFADGFSGIIVKKFPYEDYWMVQIVDGEQGTLFVKTYDHFPNEDSLVYDSVFPWIFNNQAGEKELKPSLKELFLPFSQERIV